MKRTWVAAFVMALAATACVGGGGETRTVLVDYSSDRYSNFSLYDYPHKIEVHPGTTIVFRQTWTGEPHTVTGGAGLTSVLQHSKAFLDLFVNVEALQSGGTTLPDPGDPSQKSTPFADLTAAVKRAQPADRRDAIIDAWRRLRAQGLRLPDFDNPGRTTLGDVGKVIDDASNKAFADLPSVFPDDNSGINQNYAQPCYLREGLPSKDPKKACSKSEQQQPVFDGRNSYYSSGLIRYEGQTGNTFRIPLSKDIKPGAYQFFCAVHGPLQGIEVDVRPSGERIPSQADVTKQSRKEIDATIKPLDELWADAQDNKITTDQNGQKTTLSGPFAGLQTPEEFHAAIADMVPKVFTVKAGAPITWKMMGGQHTISFGVPPYFPPVEFLKDGTVRLNPKLTPPAGGAPKPPDQAANENGSGGGGGILKIDGGTYSGTGFWSSGFIGSDPYLEYTLRVAKPGRYRYACLLHPSMVGTLVVTP